MSKFTNDLCEYARLKIQRDELQEQMGVIHKRISTDANMKKYPMSVKVGDYFAVFKATYSYWREADLLEVDVYPVADIECEAE